MPAIYRWVFLLLTTSLFQAALPSVAGSAEAPSTERTIYVLSHGWHTGIALRYADIPAQLWPEKSDFVGRAYLEVGWGDEAFYRAPKVTLGMALRAALMPTQSVLHVVGFDRSVSEYFVNSDIVALRVSVQGAVDLVRFIHTSLVRPHGQRAQPLGPGLYGESWFYPAKGRYSVFYNCNHWVAEGLRRAGVPMNVDTAMTAGNVIYQASRVGESLR